MSDGRDPAIKLFGRKIPLLEEQAPMEEGDVADSAPAMEPLSEEEKDTCGRKATIEVVKSMPGAPAEPDPKEPPPALNNSTELPKETSTDTAKAADKPQPEQDHKEAADAISGQDKLLKKPDKVLPCPRCNSMDTKFCYFNNYNVNQPRHFCKNCQRYWTAGGSMRNVPVGAGRRKNKHAASTYRHTMISPDALASVHGDGPDSIDPKPPSPFNGNGTLLKFGPDAPLCESMAAMLNLGEENREEASSSSPCKPEENGFPENTEQNSMNSSSNVSTPLPHLQFFPGPLWGCYPWHPGWSNAAAAMAAAGCSAQTAAGQDLSWNQPPLLASAFCSPYPIPFLPPFWGWGGGQPWTVASSPSSPTTTGHCSGNVSPTLGKHSREEKTEKSLWIPKTLRIDDPDEAAKSSIFATLGIKLDRAGKFRAFSSRSGNGEEEASNAAQVRRANPAAMSRSQSFQEITL